MKARRVTIRNLSILCCVGLMAVTFMQRVSRISSFLHVFFVLQLPPKQSRPLLENKPTDNTLGLSASVHGRIVIAGHRADGAAAVTDGEEYGAAVGNRKSLGTMGIRTEAVELTLFASVLGWSNEAWVAPCSVSVEEGDMRQTSPTGREGRYWQRNLVSENQRRKCRK